MNADSRVAPPAFGFLTVLESTEHGLFGGYLALSPQGRPLEFRCTTPVVATRAQEILYGPTLRPYLLSEVIGVSLLRGAQLPVDALLTDQRAMMPLADLRREPVLLVRPDGVDAADETSPWANCADSHGVDFRIGGCRLSAAGALRTSVDQWQQLLTPLAVHVHLAEPFERIRAALIEAQQAHDAVESNDGRAAA